ncbi:MAG: DNA polymerase II large subunit [Thermoproteota archaeon]|nr:MAG: DNA polymerase II large subunit [Candidatus Korarchaeota archaeon]
MNDEEYINGLDKAVDTLIELANEARSKGFDVALHVESEKANTLPERVVALFGYPKIGERISYWLSKGLGKRELAFKMADEILAGNLGLDLGPAEKAELAIRVGLSIMTGATVSAPVEGINKVVIRRNPDDGSHYLSVYFNGPIRTAGGTDGALVVVLADYIRQKLGLAPYKPGPREIGRYVEEVSLYKRVQHLQYNSRSEEVRYVAEHLPVEINGPPTEKIEVSAYRNLRTVETNRLRGGAILVLNDCILQKAPKLLMAIKKLRAKGYDIKGWDWLEWFQTKSEEETEGEGCPYIKPSYKYLRESVAGRPILSYPQRPGGFRLRYGRSRITGLASIGVHPATMYVLDEFLAIGTQVRIERPGKSAIVLPVNSIEGPIVRLKNGSVIRIESVEMAKEYADEVDRILFLGDVLVAFGEFLQNNHPLLPSAWVEEWWEALLKKAAEEKGEELSSDLVEIASKDFDEAIRLSLLYNVPLHPRWTYFWHDITIDQLSALYDALRAGDVRENMIQVDLNEEIKEILEAIGVPHEVDGQKIVIKGGDAKSLIVTLGGLEGEANWGEKAKWDVLSAINELSPVKIMPKAPFYIGMRVGRPEKAKPRAMKPPVNLLFPIGTQKGRSRSASQAYSAGIIVVDIALRRCPECGRETPMYFCRTCGRRTEQLYFCPKCGRELPSGGTCPVHRLPAVKHRQGNINFRNLIDEVIDTIFASELVDLGKIRCVIGLTNEDKCPEPLEKGVLRSKYGLYVFKDGTCRFDATNAVMTHFKPSEIGTPIEKLRELGYTHDVNGQPLEREDQLLELKINDIIIPEEAAEYLYRVSKFVDDELELFYGLPRFYNLREPRDLVGHIVFTISPHTFIANVARIIGFTKASVIFAHPFLHAAKRRNADGDEDSIILGLDLLLNFSRHYLPATPGGREDAPLLIVTKIDLNYIDDESYNMEVVERYPLEFYESTYRYESPSNLEDLIPTVGKLFFQGIPYPKINFTNTTRRADEGPLMTTYRKLDKMLDKLEKHVELELKIRAVNPEDSIARAITSHFLRDVSGNLRKFSMQSFRCSTCNAKYRRLPLSGKCEKCGGNLVLTMYPRSAVKYIEPALKTLEAHNLMGYVHQRLKLLEEEARSMFTFLREGEKLKEEMLEEVEPVRRQRLVDFL